ncbi:potassium channel family protein [Lignipirellula cremea]|uniref:Voltage-gated potassium channel Kch n=1 Tax=Lignipirellula cremea TaxID=2528010 RepID=A0A518DM35_9BACT|nr:potassium channel protein [Lignipirellula cremea]QDU92882.1 Voltage-gated potassium channel Kch [Lignipirellula cremea]
MNLVTGPFQRIITGIVFFVIVCGLAVLGYLWAGWSLMDALYMTVITIFGVGYGEVQPVHSPGLRALTISTIVAGYAAVIYTVGGFVQMLIDGELNKALGARRMTRGIDRMHDHTIICGYGRIGAMLADHLAAAKVPFVVIDQNTERITQAEEKGYLVLQGNAAEEDVLRKAGVARARFLASVLSDDAANLYVTITARELNEGMEILARGENVATERKLLRCGASQVVMPTAIGAARIAQLIRRPSAESLLKSASEHGDLDLELSRIGLQLDELKVQNNSPLVGRTIGDIEIRGNLGFLILALKKADETIDRNPSGDTQLAVGDTVIVLGHQDDIPRLVERYALKKQVYYRGARVDS